MCGITGIFNLRGESISCTALRMMTDAIAHRGPDGEGFYIDNNIGLGHRRLSIIDPSAAGHQPMTTSDGQFVISFNGEVYNFKDLRLPLETLGHRFVSQTDSEVVLKSYAEFGVEAFKKFNGMFALAIWDKRKRRLVLARDRYGIKPLYYCLLGQTLIFASEIKAFLAYPEFRAAIDRESLLEYMTFQNLFGANTLFKDVRLLLPGSYIVLSQDTGHVPSPTCYWDYNFCEPAVVSDMTEYAEELARLFRQAVNRQLVSDVEIGSYLSGGMDSGSISAVAASQLPYIKTFTIGFDISSMSGVEVNYDERVAAERMSYLFKTEHYEMVLKAGDMERILPSVTWYLDEPRVGQSYPNYYAAQLASKFTKVVLGGTGGDELFGGYPWRYYRAVTNNDFEHYIDKYYRFWQRLIPTEHVAEVFSPIWADISHVNTRNTFRDVFQTHANELTTAQDYVNHSLYFEAKTFLHSLLIVEDKLSMAHGLESRVPFLDNELVDFAMGVPVNAKLGNLHEVMRLNENDPGNKVANYYTKTRDGKLLLREAMKRYIPEDITNLAKQGFSAPDAAWFKGDSIHYVKRALMEQNSPIFEYLDRTTIRKLVDDHLSGRVNRRLLIWSLLNLDSWCRQFLLGERLSTLRPSPSPHLPAHFRMHNPITGTSHAQELPTSRC